MPSAIPVQNIYYLLVYAWDRLTEAEVVDVSRIDSTQLVDLYAAVLCSGLKHLMRRGLHQDYVVIEDDLAGIRGRVDTALTARRMLAQHGRAHCRFDELNVDVLPNRILLATLRRLLRSEELDAAIRADAQALTRKLAAISSIPLSLRTFRSVQLYGQSRFYRFLLDLCELIVQTSFISEANGNVKFRDFVRDPKAMARLYEKFLFNFYRHEKPQASVTRDRIRWVATSTSDPDLQLLPSMQTDITIRVPGRTIVMDAKFYEQTLQMRFEAATVHSANLYQLFAYLKNLEILGEQDAVAEGVLLYPVVDSHIRQRYEIAGHILQIATVDLGRDWKEIRKELLKLVA